MRGFRIKTKREYPRKCKHCPKILNSEDQENRHIKRHHLK